MGWEGQGEEGRHEMGTLHKWGRKEGMLQRCLLCSGPAVRCVRQALCGTHGTLVCVSWCFVSQKWCLSGLLWAVLNCSAMCHSAYWELEYDFVAFPPLYVGSGVKLQTPGCKASGCILPTSCLAGPKKMIFFCLPFWN